MQPLVVLCTAPDVDVAARLARGLVEARHAACVNILGGVRSFYRWEDKVQDDPEVQLIIKTQAERFEALRTWLVEHHPYDVPEVIALPIAQGHQPYLDWMGKETSPA